MMHIDNSKVQIVIIAPKAIAHSIYSGSHSDAVQHSIARCRGMAVPCPYRCTSHKREPLYVEILHTNPLFKLLA
ncbi:MAG: hypothetical protein V7K32_04350 [Nostoc sp.]